MYKPAHSTRNTRSTYRASRRDYLNNLYHANTADYSPAQQSANVDDAFDAARDTYGRLWK